MADVSDRFRLDGRVVFVTGAGSGLGRALACGLASFGAIVACTDRDRDGVAETCRAIEEANGKGVAAEFIMDVTREDDVSQAVDAVVRSFGTIDVLINNAGIAGMPVRTHEMAAVEWDKVIATNLKGVFQCTRFVLPVMLRQARGSIINITSIAGLRGYFPGRPAIGCHYAAAKAGLVGFTMQLAAEYAAENIRANAIAPGWHSGTRLGEQRRLASGRAANEAFEQILAARTPLRRRGTPDELVGLVVYLAADASSYVTGQTIAHDGGWTAV